MNLCSSRKEIEKQNENTTESFNNTILQLFLKKLESMKNINSRELLADSLTIQHDIHYRDDGTIEGNKTGKILKNVF